MLATESATKQEIIKSTAEAATESKDIEAAQGSAKAAADTSPRKLKPRMGDYQKALGKAATP